MVDFAKKLKEKQMAAKKPTATLTKYDAELAALASQFTETAAELGGGGNFIKTQGGVFTYKGETIGEKMNLVIVAAVLHNAYYDGPYDSDNPGIPVCYAFGESAKGMAPHADSTGPQNETCKGCEKNEFGSADKGKGKACGNRVRFGCITDGDLDSIEDAEVCMLQSPPTSGPNWKGYCDELKDTWQRPPLAVITEVHLVRDAKTQFKMLFRMIEKIDDHAQIGALLALRPKVLKELVVPYQVIEKTAPAPRKTAGRKKF